LSAEYLQDRAAIHDLFTRYCCALDNGEVETVTACFTADAVLKSPVIDLRGHDAIGAFARRFAAQRGRHPVPPHGHQHSGDDRRRPRHRDRLPARAD
jgi:hypothetical protein